MPRSANALGNAREAAGDGGIGAPSGMTSSIWERSRSPRASSRSCSMSAVSLGAGGHLNGVDVTPTITRPPANRSSTSRTPNAPSTV
ncbi:hypothetical protein OHA72_26595 [Dactylosporangium sp. NBC_01737]|uniref:hypothetical protein n=1 Tax=Dactylosporangium sp. NBC_01737 TaxID=2975959 RepID=UPI002E0DA710|nr:hypothetical protein OHA72_26595 [Dactylosporangium sp. NBC_01737]